MVNYVKIALLVSAVCMEAVMAHGLEVSSVIGDHMVLQRDARVALWGWDTAGTELQISFRGQTASAKADSNGKWLVRIPSGDAGGPFILKIQGSSELVFNDVLVGEVWIAGGQSNMWWPLVKCENADKEIAAADYPRLRMWDANTADKSAGWQATTPQRTVKAKWEVTTPETAKAYPGVPYFFARDLFIKLQVPVGVLNLAVPGTDIEMHMSKALGDACPPSGTDKKPKEDNTAGYGQLFNGMVLPAAPFTAKGFLWWQGENNADRPTQYKSLLAALIQEWRTVFEIPDAPFLFVELHNFGNRIDRMQDAPWPALRDAQRATMLKVRNAYLVGVLDICPDPAGIWEIHPTRKQVAAERLLHAALVTAYGNGNDVGFGPRFKQAIFKDGAAVLSFECAGGGLQAVNGGELKAFTLAGADQKFFNAAAVIKDGTIVVTAKEVPQPVAVRYAWANNPVGNLVNKDGLPATAFRSDDWELKMDK